MVSEWRKRSDESRRPDALPARAGALALLLGAKTLPEAWPITGAPLFMFSAQPARRLARACMTGQTRLVLGADAAHLTPGALVAHAGPQGARIARDAARVARSNGAVTRSAVTRSVAARGPVPLVHDGVMRALGFTVVQSPQIRDAISCGADLPEERWRAELLRAVGSWLVRERRLHERSSGQLLTCAAWVRVGGGDGEPSRIEEVIATYTDG